MSQVIKLKEEKISIKKFSIRDLRLKRFMELTELKKTCEKELSQLKDEIKHEGSFSTNHYIAMVKETTRTSPPSLAILIKKYGHSVTALCKISTFKTVTVSKKGA